MGYSKSAVLSFIIGLAGLCISVRPGLGQDELSKLLERLTTNTLDVSVLYSLEGQPPDARTIPALAAAFEQKELKKEKQWVAATLLRLGEKSDRYFDFLAGYAREAVEDRTPSFERYDANGRAIRGQFSAEFENWCAQNGKDPRAVTAIQLGVYPEDVLMLAKAQDQRALDLFKQGLDSPNPGVVGYSVQGLARLQDITAIPLIARTAERLPIGARGIIAMQLPWYSRPEAEPLIARLVPDQGLRDSLKREVQMQQFAELSRALRRQGKPPSK
jgi:hypothetical protein